MNYENHEPERYELFAVPAREFHLTRRDFLQTLGGGLFVVLAIANSASDETASAQESGGGRRAWGREMPQEIGAWLHIGEDNSISVFTGKVEFGQDIRTSLAQVVAEELRVKPETLRLMMGDTDLTPYDAGTFGSRTTPFMAPQLRRVAATTRELLLDLAAQHAKVERATLAMEDGRVHHAASGRLWKFGALTRGQKLVQRIRADVATTPPEKWTIAGTSTPKINARALATGEHHYTSDMTRPSMLWGKVLRPETFRATLQVLADDAARALPDVVVVREGDFVGVAAPHPDTAEKALSALKATWAQPVHPSGSAVFEYFRDNVDKVQGERNPQAQLRGSVAQGLALAEQIIEATYNIAFIAHAPLEPRAALAEWNGDKLTVWTGTQRPFGVRAELAEALNIPENRVRVIVPDTGSGYGGKHTGETAIEAARLARAAKRPVKLVWTREEEFTWAYFRPGGQIEAKAGVTRNGTLTAWEFHNINSGNSGIQTPYEVAHQHIEFHPIESPLRQGSYRALAATANHFARETLMDEIAHQLGQDPLEFRLRNLKHERLRAVLQAAAQRFGWGKRAVAGHGFGLAVGTEKNGYVANCVEVSVRDNQIKVERVVTAFECGAIINPDGLQNQVEGSIVQGLGGALFEEIHWDQGRIKTDRFSKYRMPRFSDLPKLETVLLDRKDLPSSGAGEAPIITIAPAIGNAVFAATGVRLRAMPLTLSKA